MVHGCLCYCLNRLASVHVNKKRYVPCVPIHSADLLAHECRLYPFNSFCKYEKVPYSQVAYCLFASLYSAHASLDFGPAKQKYGRNPTAMEASPHVPAGKKSNQKIFLNKNSSSEEPTVGSSLGKTMIQRNKAIESFQEP